MKILTPYGFVSEIFALYQVNGQTKCLGTSENWENSTLFDISEVTVIDPVWFGKFVYFNDGIYHWALIELGFLDGVMKQDINTYTNFKKVLIMEGRISADS